MKLILEYVDSNDVLRVFPFIGDSVESATDELRIIINTAFPLNTNPQFYNMRLDAFAFTLDYAPSWSLRFNEDARFIYTLDEWFEINRLVRIN